jgi:hypothetical protein
LSPASGETPGSEQWVEFVQNGQVKGKAVVSVVKADQVKEVAKEPAPAAGHARVDVLKGNKYVRVWINKGGDSYLLHLATAS